uniref:spore germination protein GerPC n=1 Tax=Bacillus mycoides TaxID=1405 RepID=UPI001C930C7D
QQIQHFQVHTETLKLNPQTQTNPHFYQHIIQQIHPYLHQQPYTTILHFEQQDPTPLHHMYRQIIIHDIKKQIQ